MDLLDLPDPRTRSIAPKSELDVKLNPGDLHVLINPNKVAGQASGKVYRSDGSLVGVRIGGQNLADFPCLCDGVHGPGWKVTGGDTVPGSYQVGRVIPTLQTDSNAIWAAYGKYALELLELDHQESDVRRAGLMIHGGGSASPNPLAPRQGLYATLGCVRLENIGLEDFFVPLVQKTKAVGCKVFVTVGKWAYDS